MVGLSIFLVVVLFLGYKSFGDANAIKSMVSPQEILRIYKVYYNEIEITKINYKPQSLQAALFSQSEELNPGMQHFLEFFKNIKYAFLQRQTIPLENKGQKGGVAKLANHKTQASNMQLASGSFNVLQVQDQNKINSESLPSPSSSLNGQVENRGQKRSLAKLANDKTQASTMRLASGSFNVLQVQDQNKINSEPLPSPSGSLSDQKNKLVNTAISYDDKNNLKNNKLESLDSFRSLSTAYSNVLFRWFIWQDMWEELVQSRSLFGIGFGKPQRSKSIEILDWAHGEWWRDGWITPHNSYFHMIYRAGLVGVLIIFGMIYIFIRLLKDFIILRSIKGILCLSALLYWMVLANFLVILEFPYNAVFFWSLFGMTFAYAQDLKIRKTYE